MVTTPDVLTRTTVILTAKEMNPELHVFVRARYLQEWSWLEQIGVTDICIEEGETVDKSGNFAASRGRIQKEIQKSRAEFVMCRRNGQIIWSWWL